MHYWREPTIPTGSRDPWLLDGPLGKQDVNRASSLKGFTGRRDTPTGVALIERNFGAPDSFVAVVRMSPWSPVSTSGAGGEAVTHPGENAASYVPDYMIMYELPCGSSWHGHEKIPILVDGRPVAGVSAF